MVDLKTLETMMDPEMMMADSDPLLALMNAAVTVKKQGSVVLPEEMEADAAQTYDLYGYLRMDTNCHVIYGWGDHRPADELQTGWIGMVCDNGEARERALRKAQEMGLPACLLGERQRDGALRIILHDMSGGEAPLEKKPFSLIQNIFSRNSGLLETDWLKDKCVMIVGLGSGGSCAAMHMARSGVGRFILVDSDVMEIHNTCRHQLTLMEVGRYKVDAVAERIRRINPGAEIRIFRRRVQDVPADDVRDWLGGGRGVIVGGCDNYAGDACASDLAVELGVPFVSQGLFERAWGGYLFVYLPVRGDICYRCVYGRYIEEEAEHQHTAMYVAQERAAEARVVNGIAVDVEYAVSLLSKTVLDVLNLYQPGYVPRLLYDIGQLTWFSGTADRSMGEEWKEILPEPLSLRVLGLSDEMRQCAHCRKEEAS